MTGGHPGDEALPEPVRDLIGRCIDSIAELEALLLLHNEPESRWDVGAVSRRLYIPEAQVRKVLQRLADCGLAADEGGCWRFRCSSPQTAGAVTELAALYSRRLIAITTLIHEKPARGIEAFARAFVLRRND